jgi:hypothetical protein
MSVVLTGLPDQEVRGGFIYVAKRCDGAIKVGGTRTPKGRAATLQAQVKRQGKAIVRMHFEDTKTWPFCAEKRALNRMRAIAQGVPGTREWFTGCAWRTALEQLKAAAEPAPQAVAQ